MNEVSSQPDCDGRLRRLFAPHIESFDYALDAGLEQAVAALEPEEVAHPSADSRPLCFWLESVAVARPMRTDHGTIQGGERHGRVNAARAGSRTAVPCMRHCAGGWATAMWSAWCARRSAGDGRLETVSPARTVGGFPCAAPRGSHRVRRLLYRERQ